MLMRYATITSSLVVVHLVLTLGQRRTGGPALNNTCVCRAPFYQAEKIQARRKSSFAYEDR